MKRKAIIYSVIAILLVVITATLIWYVTPKTFLKGISAAEVSSIDIFDGSTGKSMTVDNPDDIKTVVENIQSVKMKRGKLSVGYDGYSFSLTFKDKDGEAMDSLIINSADIIRDDPFFYKCENGALCYDFLNAIVQVQD